MQGRTTTIASVRNLRGIRKAEGDKKFALRPLTGHSSGEWSLVLGRVPVRGLAPVSPPLVPSPLSARSFQTSTR